MSRAQHCTVSERSSFGGQKGGKNCCATAAERSVEWERSSPAARKVNAEGLQQLPAAQGRPVEEQAILQPTGTRSPHAAAADDA